MLAGNTGWCTPVHEAGLLQTSRGIASHLPSLTSDSPSITLASFSSAPTWQRQRQQRARLAHKCAQRCIGRGLPQGSESTREVTCKQARCLHCRNARRPAAAHLVQHCHHGYRVCDAAAAAAAASSAQAGRREQQRAPAACRRDARQAACMHGSCASTRMQAGVQAGRPVALSIAPNSSDSGQLHPYGKKNLRRGGKKDAGGQSACAHVAC